MDLRTTYVVGNDFIDYSWIALVPGKKPGSQDGIVLPPVIINGEKEITLSSCPQMCAEAQKHGFGYGFKIEDMLFRNTKMMESGPKMTNVFQTLLLILL